MVKKQSRTPHASARERLLSGLPVTERRLSLSGLGTAVLEGGSGPPLVLLHGPGAYGAAWREVIPDLVTTHRVIAPDLPGHGESETFEGRPDPEVVSAWLDDLIRRTCQDPPVLVGHTLGGAIAARFASERGARLSALVLVDALGLAEFQPAPEFGRAVNEYLSTPTVQTHDNLWRRCLYDLPAVQSRIGDLFESIRDYDLDRLQAPGRLDALRNFMGLFGVPAIPTETLARIAVPTSLIWGRHDLATPLAVAEEASARFGWDLHVVEGSADDPAIEQPEAFLKALRVALHAFQEEVAR
jgi:pimeloyl-ACP methyl ester carboxylesterase